MADHNELFTEMEIDAIGEILNISMGASATSISMMLDKRVVITTPSVEVQKASDFHFESFEPAVGVEINYTGGLLGTNMMILKESDVKAIVDLLLQREPSDEKFVLDEISNSAICEVMNQMMGSSATALSQLLDRPVNISPPSSFQIENSSSFKKQYYPDDSTVVSVCFHLSIEEVLESEFISVLSAALAKELIGSLHNNAPAETAQPQDQEQAAPQVQTQPEAPVPQPQPQPRQETAHQQPPAQPGMNVNRDPGHSSGHKISPAEARYHVQGVEFSEFQPAEPALSEEQSNNLNLIMSVPLQISVELGRTKKQIKDILTFSPGTIIELDKQAGAMVDIFVNGQQVSRGEVVVVEDCYGVRVSEIISNNDLMKIL
ncbi:MAG TPA: flagellar motor switch phosphatase FliY [Clostridiales bacterium]|nr:flagellar motor switch phosphatase FliY [Clostridiales bacterium]